MTSAHELFDTPPSRVGSAGKISRSARARRFVAAFALIGVLAGCLSPAQQSALDALNGDRNLNGRASLPTQGDVQDKAQQWADQLAREGALYHSNLPDGISARWCSLGENVAYGQSVTANEAGFMGSPHHRANILDAGFNGVGVGVARNGNTVWTVQEFITTC